MTTTTISKSRKQECNGTLDTSIVQNGMDKVISFEGNYINNFPENETNIKCPGKTKFLRHLSIMEKIDLLAFTFLTFSYLTFNMIYFLS